MRTKGIIGRRIKAVHQQRVYNTRNARWETAIAGIELDNGRTIRFGVCETEDLPFAYAYDGAPVCAIETKTVRL